MMPRDGQLAGDIGGVADQSDGLRFLLILIFIHQSHGLFQVIHHAVHVAHIQASFGTRRVHFDDQSDAFVHGDGHRLRAAHSAQTGRQAEFPLERTPAFEPGQGAEGFVSPLQDALRADIDPRTGGHLAVHDETLGGQLVEVLPSGPVRHQVGVGDQDARRVLDGF